MIILGIETSCDDTGIAIIKTPDKKSGSFKILSNVVSSQIKVHAKYGGVVPNLAAREHLKNITPCLKTAFKEAGVKPKQIDLIATTIGPGLIPSLLIGVNFTRTLAYAWEKPIVAVNHIEAHILANYFENKKINFPAIALVVSGGHTQLILIKKLGHYKILGETRDDAAGECFDKIAKLLNLGYPGGPKIATKAKKLQATSYKLNLPRPMINQKNYDFSFSGLKTAVLYLIKNQKSKIKSQKFIQEICHESQQAIIDVLIEKTLRAAKEYRAKTIILAGGVAANEKLRKQMAKRIKKEIHDSLFIIPDSNLCTDNGAMVAAAGYFNKPTTWRKIKADANLRIGQKVS